MKPKTTNPPAEEKISPVRWVCPFNWGKLDIEVLGIETSAENWRNLPESKDSDWCLVELGDEIRAIKVVFLPRDETPRSHLYARSIPLPWNRLTKK